GKLIHSSDVACKGGSSGHSNGLMEHGADAKIRNVEGITASDVASANEFWDLCAVIELMEPQATADITEVYVSQDVRYK
ncbi:hypothetical protein GBAR_LOCUS26918, partial [Geodia barretti]